MATPKRRSCRLSRKSSTPERSAMRKTVPTHPQLGSLLERDETPEAGPQSTIDQILSTPNDPPQSSLRDRIAQLSAIKTSKTLPRVAHTDMNPKDVHQTTASPPDSGFRLGFADVSTKGRPSVASAQNSPTKSQPRQSPFHDMTSSSFEFKFATESNLSDEAQKLMENVRDEAARIKAQMLAEKQEQERKDDQAENLFGDRSAVGRRFAKPKGKAGRFSDVHMAEFKKMDSIANHVSSFRGQPGFARPTTQSLKRSGSKAGFDEPERPRTAGKGTPGRVVPAFMRPSSISPFKSISTTKTVPGRLENMDSAKRMRQSESQDVSNGRPTSSGMLHDSSKPSGLPRVKSTLSSSIHSPTKSSLSRSASTKVPRPSPDRKPSLPRSNSVRSLKSVFEAVRAESVQPSASPTPNAVFPALASALPRIKSTKSVRPLPPLPVLAAVPTQPKDALTDWSSMKNLPTATPKTGGLASRLPTFTGLKSILRSSRAPIAKATCKVPLDQADGTPKRTNINVAGSGSVKKVDFTPSTKSRYAVKLAAATPSPSKISRVGNDSTPATPLDPYDSAAYTIDDSNEANDEDWEDAESEIFYPTLPSSSSPRTTISGPSVSTFSDKAKQHNRRESKEFKSIFTTLEHSSRPKPAVTLTDVNTRVNQTNPTSYVNIVTRSSGDSPITKPSPSTIRHVRTSGATQLVQPFKETINTVPHSLPGKKRRRELDNASDLHGVDEDAKENRRLSIMPQVPGGWDETDKDVVLEGEEDEGEKRGGKKARVGKADLDEKLVGKKPKLNIAREAAAKNAKDRKGMGKGILSLSRLNMLARPKERK